jgi:hypothetical protein
MKLAKRGGQPCICLEARVCMYVSMYVYIHSLTHTYTHAYIYTHTLSPLKTTRPWTLS